MTEGRDNQSSFIHILAQYTCDATPVLGTYMYVSRVTYLGIIGVLTLSSIFSENIIKTYRVETEAGFDSYCRGGTSYSN